MPSTIPAVAYVGPVGAALELEAELVATGHDVTVNVEESMFSDVGGFEFEKSTSVVRLRFELPHENKSVRGFLMD